MVDARVSRGDWTLDLTLHGGRGPLALIGPNGAGKSTVLKLLAGGVTPLSGRIRMGAVDWFDSEAGLNLAPEFRRVAYVPQDYALFGHLSALQNVMFGLTTGRRRGSRSELRTRATEALARFGAADLGARRPGELSGGQRQRVALARAWVTEPVALLLDEPMAALDVAARRSVRTELYRYLRALDVPSILVTHDARDVEPLGGRVAVVEDGRITQVGVVDQIRRNPASAFVSEFFGR